MTIAKYIDIIFLMKVSIYYAKTFKDSSAALMKALSESPAEPSIRNFLLVPDKLTLSAETEVLYASKSKGTFNTMAFSFTRLCSHLGRGAEKGKYLNKQSSVELFARIISENRDALKCFGGVANRSGFAEVVYNTVSKLRYCLISPADLRKFEGSGHLGQKTADIALLYEKYNEYLKDRFYDSSSKLDILYELLENPAALKGVRILLKDYDNFSRQEMRIIKRMIASAESVSVACTRDCEKPHLYKNEIYNDLISVCGEFNIKPDLIDGDNPCDGVIEKIKENLFSYSPATAAEHGGRIRIVSAPDAFSETESAARYIAAKVREGQRYKDFTVVAASLADYRIPLVRAFTKYEIPCYLDESVNLAEHSLGRFLTAAIKAKTDGLTLSTALPVVKSFFGCPEYADEFENFCLRHNIKYFKKPFEEGKYSRGAEAARKYLVDTLAKFALPKTGKTEEFTAAVREFLKTTKAEEKLSALGEAEKLAGIESRARVTAQASGKTEEVLAGAETVLGGYFLADTDFADIFLSGLRAVNLSSVPMHLDSVFAGELTTSKYHAVKNLIVLGANDGVIPSENKDTELLSENNIRELRGKGINIEPGIAAENAREKFNVFQLMCEPSGDIYLSYPLADCRGQKLKESRLITDFHKIFAIQPAATEGGIFTRGEAAQSLCSLAGGYADFRFGEWDTEYKKMNALFYALGEEFREEAPPQEKIASAEKIYSSGKFSPSKIETFYDCPYKHFLNYGLKLRARETPDLMPFDTGSILHAVAENFVKAEAYQKSPEEIKKTAENLLDAELGSGSYKKIKSSADFAVMRARLADEAVKLCLSISEGLKNSGFVPYALELDFTRRNLIGKVDRADKFEKFVRVIDYKTGKIDTAFKDIYTGRRLQLFTYLNAAAEETGLAPAGAYYFPVQNDFEPADAEEKTTARLIGYTLNDIGAVFGADTALSAEKTDSTEIPVKIKKEKDGSLAVKGSKALTAAEMETLLRYADYMIKTAGAEIEAGNIKISPFEGACGRCDFSPVCEGREKKERRAPTLDKDNFGGV